MITDDELPRITKESLRAVGIKITERRADDWLLKGFLLLEAHLARNAMFGSYLTDRDPGDENG